MAENFLISACLLAALLASPLAAQQLEIHHIDVDQGDATLFVLPNGSTFLVDAGLDGKGAAAGAYIRSLGIDTVDAFVLTHYDADHLGGVDKLGVPIRTFFDRGGWTVPQSGSCQLCQYQQLAVGSRTELTPGSTIALDPQVSIRVVAVNSLVSLPSPFPEMTNADQENDRSVALMVSWEGFNYFIAGDLTRPVEDRLLLEAAIGDVDVYHVSHHAAETSSSNAFMQQIRPEVAIISNGDHGGFNHPRLAVLDTLQMVPGITIFQTNRLAKVTNSSSGLVGGNVGNDDQIQDLEPDGQDGAVVIRVSNNSYTVEVPRSGLVLSFAIELPD